MKKHLNTLFITNEKASIFRENQTIVVKVEKEIKLRVPIHTIGGVVCFGMVYFSPQAVGFCAENGVTISFLSPNGKFFARVIGPTSGNILLRKRQFKYSDDLLISAEIAKSFVIGKILNSRAVISRAIRDHQQKVNAKKLKEVVSRLTWIANKTEKEIDLDKIRGNEGEASRIYFNVFNELITTQKEDFVFNVRNRRPPLDYINSMLSFVYTLLLHDIRSALETVGLDPQAGFLHRDRPGRLGLALDMMEEFRPFFADRLVLSMINLRKVRKNGFKIMENGAVYMEEKTKKEILKSYQNRKQNIIIHPFLKEKTTVGLLFFVQAILLARFIRGDLEDYPPFIWK